MRSSRTITTSGTTFRRKRVACDAPCASLPCSANDAQPLDRPPEHAGFAREASAIETVARLVLRARDHPAPRPQLRDPLRAARRRRNPVPRVAAGAGAHVPALDVLHVEPRVRAAAADAVPGVDRVARLLLPRSVP